MLTSANAVSAVVYKGASNLTAYFHLRDINEDLQRRNSALELEVINLKQQLERTRELVYADTMTTDSALQRYSFILARVINNTTHRTHNYITIDKGSADGIRPEWVSWIRTAWLASSM